MAKFFQESNHWQFEEKIKEGILSYKKIKYLNKTDNIKNLDYSIEGLNKLFNLNKISYKL